MNLKTRPERKNPDPDSNLFLDPHSCASSHSPLGAQAHNDNNQDDRAGGHPLTQIA